MGGSSTGGAGVGSFPRRELVDKLAAIGVQETERNIANKISRGGFTAAFMIQCLAAIGATTVRLED